MTDVEIDIESLKSKLEALPDAQKAGLMAPTLIYIGRALDEFGEHSAAIKVAEAAVILIANMEPKSSEDLADQQKCITELHFVIDRMKRRLQAKKKEH